MMVSCPFSDKSKLNIHDSHYAYPGYAPTGAWIHTKHFIDYQL